MRKKQHNLPNRCLILGSDSPQPVSNRILVLAITRRNLLQGGAVAAVAPALGAVAAVPTITPAHAQAELPWRHALSLFGDVKYPADFKRFDYINPDAPKGGAARMISIGTFDNFNVAVAGIKGSIAPAAAMIYETLMTRSQDEVTTEYGLLADCLLYTSPSPRDRTRSRMPSSA